MPFLLTCPEGHQWEIPSDDGLATTSYPAACPVCGAGNVSLSPLARSESSWDIGALETVRRDRSARRALTGDRWYDDTLRLEWRLLF